MSTKIWRYAPGLFSVVLLLGGFTLQAQESSTESIIHIVKKGETVYGISKQYNIPLETIYQMNPNAKRGVKKGDQLEIPASAIENTNIRENNAKNSNVKASNENLSAGNKATEVLEEDLSIISTGDSESLKEKSSKRDKRNKKQDKKSPDNNEKDRNEDIDFTEDSEITMQAEDSNMEIQDLESAELDNTTDSISVENEDIRQRIALLLDEPNSKKDIDFTRGMLTRLDGFKNEDYKIDLKVLDGRVSTGDIIKELDDFEPNLIISTADKTFPLFLADYGNTNNIEVVNVFDLKNDLYEDNPSIIQMLLPSSYFNTKIAEKLYKENKSRKALIVGETDENDGIAEEIIRLFGDDGEQLSLEEFGSYEPDYLQPLIIYSYASRKEEVADFMNNMENLTANYPGIDYRLIGRPSWISMLDDYEDKFKENSVYIPSRVWIDETDKEWKEFYDSFERLYGGLPVRSIPNFAVSGYDIANYFVTVMAEGKEEIKNTHRFIKPGLQNSIKLSKVDDGGYLNEIGYIIKFRPESNYEKIIVD